MNYSERVTKDNIVRALKMSEISMTVITTLVTSTPIPAILPSQRLSITSAITSSLHPIHQYRQESGDDTDDGWKYAVRLYACGYRSGNFEEAIRPPPDQICVLDLRSGLYGFCKDPEERNGGKLDLKRDCSGWRGGCADAFGCKEAECSAVGDLERRNIFSEVETCTGNNPYCVISELRFSTAASDERVYRRFGCNAYPTTIDYLVTPHTAPPLATITATSDGVGEGEGEVRGGKENPSSFEKQQQQNASKTGSIIGGVVGGIALICFAVLMARCMDTKDRRNKKRQARAAAQGKRGLKAGSEAEVESDDERQQHHSTATGGGKRTWLGYNQISSLLPSARALGRYKSSFSQQQRQEPAGHSEENSQQPTSCQLRRPGRGWGSRISSSTVFPPSPLSPAIAPTARGTLIRFKPFSLWAAKRHCPPHQARAELPEECCTPATVAGWSQQRKAGLCELPAEAPEAQAFDAAALGKSSSPLNRRDRVVSVVGLEPKNGGGGERWRNDSETLVQKGPIPYRRGINENGQDLEDEQKDQKPGSSCSSRESGPLGKLCVQEEDNMNSEKRI